ncbi:unnamed protein product [Cyprideis torosa]|uniref:Cytosol aminopeptidase n=1 Tax=Cyprideis torosa TaxID=163714 RepID=A0A7R8ZPB1_9CRUS|nr:unnamed protein product [Cyprideis torosa]CAG0893538.1 unnamed protein product [Cyprideis torosa]
MKGLVVGYYNCPADGTATVATASSRSLGLESKSSFTAQFDLVKANLKAGKARIFYGIHSSFSAVALAGLGPEDGGYSEREERDEKREAIRTAMAVASKDLREVGCSDVTIDPCGDPEAAAEGVYLSTFVFEELKEKKKQAITFQVLGRENPETLNLWSQGVIKAEAQNLARYLMEMPANLMTPTIFAQEAEKHLAPLGVRVQAHDREWAEKMSMGSFLSVSNGSHEPCVFLEMTYQKASNPSDPPIALVGKGITFDSGGTSLKVPSTLMDYMRADMGGGAVIVGALFAIATLKVPVNIKALIPLTENMPGGGATKVADVVYAMNGKAIQIMNTDAEGRLVLADALCYADTFSPRLVIDIATLTGAIGVALGAAACGVFTNSTSDWNKLRICGEQTGDRMWRMPLWEFYKKSMIDAADLGDVSNISSYGPGGGSCTAAGFLSIFTKCERWMHWDMAGVMHHTSANNLPHTGSGMSGRPTRTLIAFLQELASVPASK